LADWSDWGLFGCTAGADRRRVAFGLERSRAAGPGGRTEASRLLLAGATGGHRGALEDSEELCRGRRWLMLRGGWGRRRRTAAAAAAATVAAGGGGHQ
jgi:hypothetical protein